MKSPKNILLVEDDRDDQDFFIRVLNDIESEVLYDVANNGIEALYKLEHAAILPDLIFMDINMPVMNGIECLTEIIKNPQVKNVPVVFLSSDTWQIDLARKLGAKAFIKKTGDDKTFREQLEQMINLDFLLDNDIANKTFQDGIYPF